MNFQDAFASANVWTRHDDTTVKASGTKQCRIKNVRPIGRSHQYDAIVGFKAVHFDQELIQGLLALVVAAAKSCAAMTTDCINLVNEDDTRRVLLSLLEEVAHAGCADADEHFNKVRAGDGEERHVGFARDCARQQSLACARRPHHEHAFGNAPA